MSKNIILLSDGTGNSAAKANKTNVWRLYRTLQLNNGDQIALYDDGVGSQEFLPLKLIGGVFGWGLKRNVLQLYEYLCRNYNDGDRIYMFGFSRGAFTVRTLAGFIGASGLVGEFRNEADLHKKALDQYDVFRKVHFEHRIKEWIRNKLGIEKVTPEKGVVPDIEFLGVWDTVAAYALPIDELARAWDIFLHPLRFPDQDLMPGVHKACQALALDEERQTFFPLIWNEETEEKDASGEDERIEQVWFCGVHSDVGGGYAKDELAHVTLDWMIAKVEASPHQLKFIEGERQRIADLANAHGTLHDSRSGLGAYYRYRPRLLSSLCNDGINKVFVTRPKIHESALERIGERVVPYSPTGLSEEFEIVATPPTKGVKRPRGKPLGFVETPAQAKDRVNAMERAQDVIYKRRWLYFAILIATLTLAASRFFLDWIPDGACQGGLRCVLDPVLKLLSVFIPQFLADWIDALRQNPVFLFWFAVIFIVLMYAKYHWGNLTQIRAFLAWAHIKDTGRSPPVWNGSFPHAMRNLLSPKARDRLSLSLSLIAFLVAAVVVFGLANRIAFEIRTTTGNICEISDRTTVLVKSKEEPVPIPFEADNPCLATGIMLEEGARYLVSVSPTTPATTYDWRDGRIPASPEGFTAWWGTAELILFAPARRSWSEPWYRLMGRVGNTGKQRFGIGEGPHKFTAERDGELFLFVNDTVCGLCFGLWQDWSFAYTWETGYNHGTAEVTVTRISD